MHFRSAAAAFAALSIALCTAARADAPMPTPIKSFADAYGLWVGWIDYYTRVVMTVGADGMVKFRGPRSVDQMATLRNDRLMLQSGSTDLDCGIMQETLTCHARFGTWYAELNLNKKQ